MKITIEKTITEKVEVDIPKYFKGQYFSAVNMLCPDNKHFVCLFSTSISLYSIEGIDFLPEPITEEEFMAVQRKYDSNWKDAFTKAEEE